MSEYNTEQKRLLEDFMIENKDKSFSIDEICVSLAESGRSRLPRSTVYRLIGKLTEEGRVRRFMKPGSRSASYQMVAGEHCDTHLHMRCMDCGKLFHMDEGVSEELVRKIKNCSDFSVNEEETVLYGKCSGCKRG